MRVHYSDGFLGTSGGDHLQLEFGFSLVLLDAERLCRPSSLSIGHRRRTQARNRGDPERISDMAVPRGLSAGPTSKLPDVLRRLRLIGHSLAAWIPTSALAFSGGFR